MISLLLTLYPGCASVSCNNKDTILVLGYTNTYNTGQQFTCNTAVHATAHCHSTYTIFVMPLVIWYNSVNNAYVKGRGTWAFSYCFFSYQCLA